MNNRATISLAIAVSVVLLAGCDSSSTTSVASSTATSSTETPSAATPASVTEPSSADAQQASAAVDVSVLPAGRIGPTTGTGPMPAAAHYDLSLEHNTLYLPDEIASKPLPLLLWGTGGCRDNGLGYGPFLREVASHGFFVISGGKPRFERLITPLGETPAEDPRKDAVSDLPDTSVEQIRASIEWASEQTNDPNSPYYGAIDVSRIGVMGHSCGGLQAIALLSDPRVKTGIAFNSGVLTEPPPGHMNTNVNLVVEKSVLPTLQGSIAYINGGPDDIAYVNALDDFAKIDHVPVFFGENGVGHGGTFRTDDRGGIYADVAIAWMQWQLQGSSEAGQWFAGEHCTLCERADWSVKQKGL